MELSCFSLEGCVSYLFLVKIDLKLESIFSFFVVKFSLAV
uniref:Uncharacterized protein n=1 Tax=Lepeophtheirus salmonis TaxID=72036 RepID=A0A0K2U793_LEPSM